MNQDEIGQLHQIVQGLRAEGCTLVLVEHKVQFVLDLADRIAALYQGKLLALGESGSTLSRGEVVETYLGPKGRIARDTQAPPAGEADTGDELKDGATRT